MPANAKHVSREGAQQKKEGMEAEGEARGTTLYTSGLERALQKEDEEQPCQKCG